MEALQTTRLRCEQSSKPSIKMNTLKFKGTLTDMIKSDALTRSSANAAHLISTLINLLHGRKFILNTPFSHKQPNILVTTLLTLVIATAITACSPKPSTEDNAAQTQAIVDKAVAETKKQMLAEQEAEKAKQEALVAAQAEDKARQEAAIAQAKKELLAEQQAAAKAKSHKPAAQTVTKANPPPATPAVASMTPPPPAPKKIVCTTCGTVISVTEVEAEGKGSGLGVVAGGVVGGLLGNQVGNGSGRDLATIAGAIGGAVVGNKIEKNAKKTKSYDITVKMETGEQIVFHQATLPVVATGDAVRIENDTVIKK